MALKIKTGGRKKGTPNNPTKEIKEAINQIVSNNIDKLQDDIDKLEPKDRIKAIFDLLVYSVPKLSSIDLKEDEAEKQKTTTIIFRDYENEWQNFNK